MNKKNLKRVRKAAKLFVTSGITTTTLEIKNYLRKKHSKTRWYQDEISRAMMNLCAGNAIPGLTYSDNGTFRQYYIPGVTVPKKKKKSKKKVTVTVSTKISKSKAVDLMKNSKGRFFTVKFLKKDKTVRLLNGNVSAANFMNNQGYINVKERNGNPRQVNPRTIQELRIGGIQYTVK